MSDVQAPFIISSFDFSVLFDGEIERFVQVAEGYFSSDGEEGSWSDVGSDEMSELLRRIAAGESWREAVFEYTARVGDEWLEKIILSPARSLFLDLIDLRRVESALDLGSGWGQLTRALAARVPYVLSVEPNRERLEVNRAICAQEQISNVCFLRSALLDLPLRQKALDLVLLCGVFEWLAQEGEGEIHDLQTKSLQRIYDLLSPGGQLVIAIENRTGLKYLLGERDDHTGVPSVSMLPGAEARAVFKAERGEELRSSTQDYFEYRALLDEAGFTNIDVYLAFPDYKIPQLLVPAENTEILHHFTERNRLPDEHEGYGGKPSALNSQIKGIYRALEGLHILHLLAPSFVLVARKGT